MSIIDRIERVFAEIGIEKAELVPEATLKSDLGVDSTEMVELLVALEKEFDLKVPDGIINGGTTVHEIIDYFSETVAGA